MAVYSDASAALRAAALALSRIWTVPLLDAAQYRSLRMGTTFALGARPTAVVVTEPTWRWLMRDSAWWYSGIEAPDPAESHHIGDGFQGRLMGASLFTGARLDPNDALLSSLVLALGSWDESQPQLIFAP